VSRRAARFTQAEAARFARIATSLGPAWRVIAEDGVLQLVQSDAAQTKPKGQGRGSSDEVAPERKWRL
jgi:hypothetical protein